MQYAKKMSLVPFQEGGGAPVAAFETPAAPLEPTVTPAPTRRSSSGNSIRRYALDRQTRLLNVVLKLAQKGQYDDNGMLKTDDGQVFEIVPLLLHCFSPGRSIKGLDYFVKILVDAGVNPEDLINQNVRDMMLQTGLNAPAPKRSRQIPPPPPLQGPFQPAAARAPARAEKTLEPMEAQLPTLKRKRSDDDEEGPGSKAQKRDIDWDADDSDSDI